MTPPDDAAAPGPPAAGPDVAHLDVAGCERVLRRNGLPLLIEDHSARRDVFGRSAPFLVVVLLLELTGAIDEGWPWWGNLLAVAGGAVLLAAAYAGLNALRGRRWSTLPQDVGGPELAFFVLVPAVLPMVFGGEWRAALVTAGGNLLLLGLVWVVVAYGLGSSLWWGLARIADELGASLMRLVRLLPLLMVFSLVLFYNAEVWQVFSRTGGAAGVILGAFFAGLIVLFVGLRLPTEARGALRTAAEGVPGASDLPPLTRSQRFNVAAMIGVSQLLQVLVVSAGMGIFFVALGTLTVTPEVMDLWGIDGQRVLLTFDLSGTTLVVTQVLVRVSVAIATFTGLYYAISVQVDAVYREEFVEGIGEQLREVLATRVRYVGLLAAEPSDATGAPR
ncbi:hypothetical protein ACFVQ3_16605 [Oerskovia sp. NPDC057915]|uniref:hypothetical protein n=1 Tax=Oerskovia sp. NPDC057915 TaxID=3346280 RepID=UPI0036DE4305